MPESLDVARGVEIATTVTLANDGDKPVILLFRPETVRFNVAGPAGSVSCGTTRDVDSPIRELYSTLGREGPRVDSRSSSPRCVPPTRSIEPGVYRVTPVLDTIGRLGARRSA